MSEQARGIYRTKLDVGSAQPFAHVCSYAHLALRGIACGPACELVASNPGARKIQCTLKQCEGTRLKPILKYRNNSWDLWGWFHNRASLCASGSMRTVLQKHHARESSYGSSWRPYVRLETCGRVCGSKMF